MFSPYKNSSASFNSNLKQPLHWINGIEDSTTSANFTKTSTLITNSNEIVNVTSLPIKLQCSSSVAPSSLDHQFRPILHKDEAAAFLPPQMKSDSLTEFVSPCESCTLELQTSNAANEVRPFMSSIGLESDGLKGVPELSARNDTKLTPISEDRESELHEADISKSGGHHHMDVSKQQEKCQ